VRRVKNFDTSVSSDRITVPFMHCVTCRLHQVKSARTVTLLVFIPGMLSSNLGSNSFEGFHVFLILYFIMIYRFDAVY
jgi:hypothetical protein